ncbi:sporulation protein YunB [Tissierella sp. MB52-C2]|uniref:sporulation protein YunB n=1 Tax=Tissierella sp. MB52-C2 TaxID=3070999 RepID=UPI00280A5D29|nr:sporulation protein YunB [Tissierella sp. MB52-C2]WMM23441.1 sporulation protein YunB [Tissierella sp. MB52-C2]
MKKMMGRTIHRWKEKKLIISIVIIILFAIYVYFYIDNNIKPTLIALSEIKAKAVTTTAINDTIKSRLKNNISYDDLILIKYDNNGRATLVQANMMMMNTIAADVALEVQEQLGKLSANKVDVPLGNAFNRQMIRLPSIKLEIQPQGSVNVDFSTEFEEAGINQTRHRIYLIVMTDIRMIIPLTSETLRVTTNIPIAETVIVGEVPEQYISVPKEDTIDIIR